MDICTPVIPRRSVRATVADRVPLQDFTKTINIYDTLTLRSYFYSINILNIYLLSGIVVYRCDFIYYVDLLSVKENNKTVYGQQSGCT